MGWKPYLKSRFRVIGNISNFSHNDSIERENGKYVQAICLSKLDSDVDVIVGNTYPLFWSNMSSKCDAPNPPFTTGEGFEDGFAEIAYKSYMPEKFQIVGSFQPDDESEYKEPENNGEYKVAICKEKLDSDTEVIVGGFYIVIVYPNQDKLDAPNPPFTTGDGWEGFAAISYKGYLYDKFEIVGDFIPSNQVLYPEPTNGGAYKVAICKEKLDTDVDVVVGGFYVVIVYPGQDKLDAPNPPFTTGDGYEG